MAEEAGQNRTFAPTARRREEARRQGQVALSLDLTNSVQLLAAVVALWIGGAGIAVGLLDCMRADLRAIHLADASALTIQSQFVTIAIHGLTLIGFMLGLLVVTGMGISVMQVGFHITPELLMPRWDRVSLVNGWDRLWSKSSMVRGVIAVLKVTAVAGVAYWVLRGRLAQLTQLSDSTLMTAAGLAWNLIIRVSLALAGALAVLGAIDYLFQRWRLEQSLMMTSQEMKEQLREDEGDPQVRARLRRLARDAIRNRQMKDVPGATVVVTNPTHLAIALRYDRGTMAAPKVVAKGSGFVAKRIVELARRHSVPILERKPLAQALYKAVRVGQEIPAALYYAVAEVLAYVYRLRSAA